MGGMSYPSGHASNAILTWGLIAYLYIQYAQPRLKIVRAAAISVVVISAIVFRCQFLEYALGLRPNWWSCDWNCTADVNNCSRSQHSFT